MDGIELPIKMSCPFDESLLRHPCKVSLRRETPKDQAYLFRNECRITIDNGVTAGTDFSYTACVHTYLSREGIELAKKRSMYQEKFCEIVRWAEGRFDE